MEALSRNYAIHSIAQFVEGTNVRLSYLRLLYLSDLEEKRLEAQADGLLTYATITVNGLLSHLEQPVSVWHQSPQLGAVVRLTLHEWHGFSEEYPEKVVWQATCHNPLERSAVMNEFALDTRLFAQLLRVQHPLEQTSPVYYSHEQTQTLLDTSHAATVDMRRSGAVPTWRT